MLIKKCFKCGALVAVLKDCECKDCGITCCGEPMKEVKANSVDAAIEKHKPTYEINEDELEVRVDHVMESDHYIEWIKVVVGDEEHTYYFNPGEEPAVVIPYEKGTKLYAYCNKHGLWETTVE